MPGRILANRPGIASSLGKRIDDNQTIVIQPTGFRPLSGKYRIVAACGIGDPQLRYHRLHLRRQAAEFLAGRLAVVGSSRRFSQILIDTSNALSDFHGLPMPSR